ncbi:MAG: hypothetical protein E6J17_03505 [Chloroflexi bacterium]|nr:MAG: hypothetical protein E6J17_03505 [Chloroflexota bacterium]
MVGGVGEVHGDRHAVGAGVARRRCWLGRRDRGRRRRDRGGRDGRRCRGRGWREGRRRGRRRATDGRTSDRREDDAPREQDRRDRRPSRSAWVGSRHWGGSLRCREPRRLRSSAHSLGDAAQRVTGRTTRLRGGRPSMVGPG